MNAHNLQTNTSITEDCQQIVLSFVISFLLYSNAFFFLYLLINPAYLYRAQGKGGEAVMQLRIEGTRI